MRVRIIFSLQNKGATLPFHHQYLLAQVFQELVPKTYADYDFYSFSGLKGQMKISAAGLTVLSNRVTIVFACPNEVLISEMIAQLFEKKHIMVGQLRLSPESVLQEDNPILSQEQKYVCISPIVPCLEDGSTDQRRFISPQEDEFSDWLYESTMNRMENSGLFTHEQTAQFYKFQVVPDKDYLEKLKSEDKKFARVYAAYPQHKKVEVRGYTMPFTLLAEPAVQQFVYDCGFGEYSNLGFGMLDLANAGNFSSRVRGYETKNKKEDLV
ncbi:CRISPR-associated endoribonuclease Cas6 [Flexibacter flexilis DSM 6793]|uniref:CRISPR-associated endoribonuclease Cas6 n=1 Tax=Flexibacter flexilis DSM 6793 TaxID=927664 RepID=A0A1I1FXH2_9BACT|nr:CRISPR-associated endoribonuclease Cas6 [Flexibacter flexilis]SFC04034.1 CRISPR-associated endoribonuclease Cas6 [Flexibacter flexilis DSM 6793]